MKHIESATHIFAGLLAGFGRGRKEIKHHEIDRLRRLAVDEAHKLQEDVDACAANKEAFKHQSADRFRDEYEVDVTSREDVIHLNPGCGVKVVQKFKRTDDYCRFRVVDGRWYAIPKSQLHDFESAMLLLQKSAQRDGHEHRCAQFRESYKKYMVDSVQHVDVKIGSIVDEVA